MKYIYKCEICNKEYDNEIECLQCEEFCKETKKQALALGQKLAYIFKKLERLNINIMLFGEKLYFRETDGFCDPFLVEMKRLEDMDINNQIYLVVDRELKEIK